jgi:hypothetical protein
MLRQSLAQTSTEEVMELSPEERRRIYEEEKARLASKQQGVSGTAQSAAWQSIIVPLLFALVLSVIGYYFYSRFISGSQSNRATSTVSNVSPQPTSTPSALSNNPPPSVTPVKTESPASSLTSKPTPTPKLELHVDYVDKIPVARTEDDFYAIEDAISRNDDLTALAMIQKGRVSMIENNSPIVVLEPFGYLTKIKVKKIGHSGWVKSSWIRQATF